MTSTDDELVFLPLGGSGEIGMNLNLYGYGPADDRQWVMVDLGVTFGDPSAPGIELTCPDPTFIEGERANLIAIVLTHAHEDHIGAVAHLWPRFKVPIYATAFTAALLRRKFEEANITNPPIHVVDLGAHLTLGPFDITYITLTHSIPEPNALAIRTPLGTVLHTGDWKIDPDPLIGDLTDDAALRALGDDGLLAMVCDSTNVFSPGEAGSEAKVREHLTKLISEQTGRVAVATFASNVARVQTVCVAAQKNDRHVALVGRSMHRIVEAAQEVGVLSRNLNIIDMDEAGFLPPENVLFLCTGSQGEPRAALSRIASGSHRDVSLGEGDSVIFSSRVIPGNEREIFALQNAFSEQGVKVITERDRFIHVSGHPCRDELKRMYEWARPRIAVPVHGEARHIAEHVTYAKSLGVAEAIAPYNGSVVRLAPGEAAIVDEVPSGRIHLDGRVLSPAGDIALRDRRRLSQNGHVAVALVLDEKDQLAAPVEVRAMGAPASLIDDGEPVAHIAEDAIEDAIDRMPKSKRSQSAIEEAARRTARGTYYRLWGKKPEATVLIARL
ncbi:MAG: ribonuclease J [Pseudomonadota bacterium]